MDTAAGSRAAQQRTDDLTAEHRARAIAAGCLTEFQAHALAPHPGDMALFQGRMQAALQGVAAADAAPPLLRLAGRLMGMCWPGEQELAENMAKLAEVWEPGARSGQRGAGPFARPPTSAEDAEAINERIHTALEGVPPLTALKVAAGFAGIVLCVVASDEAALQRSLAEGLEATGQDARAFAGLISAYPRGSA